MYRISETMLATSGGNYVLNQFTAEFGNIIFDGSKEGGISNCYRGEISMEQYGYINLYMDKATRTLKSVRFVLLNTSILYYNQELSFSQMKDDKIPFFDISRWAEMETIKQYEPIELSHNGKDTVLLQFGQLESIIQLNQQIQFYVDQENCLSGIKLFIPEHFNELLDRINV